MGLILIQIAVRKILILKKMTMLLIGVLCRWVVLRYHYKRWEYEDESKGWRILLWVEKLGSPNLGPIIFWWRSMTTSTVIFFQHEPRNSKLLFHLQGFVSKVTLQEGFPWCCSISSAPGETHSRIKIPCLF